MSFLVYDAMFVCMQQAIPVDQNLHLCVHLSQVVKLTHLRPEGLGFDSARARLFLQIVSKRSLLRQREKRQVSGLRAWGNPGLTNAGQAGVRIYHIMHVAHCGACGASQHRLSVVVLKHIPPPVAAAAFASGAHKALQAARLLRHCALSGTRPPGPWVARSCSCGRLSVLAPSCRCARLRTCHSRTSACSRLAESTYLVSPRPGIRLHSPCSAATAFGCACALTCTWCIS
jgi:hypothetical protein